MQREYLEAHADLNRFYIEKRAPAARRRDKAETRGRLQASRFQAHPHPGSQTAERKTFFSYFIFCS